MESYIHSKVRMNTAIRRGGEEVNCVSLDPIIQAVSELKGSIARLRQMQDDRVPLSELLTESVAYDIAYGAAPMGFIIVRHVTSKQTDYYWKECYTCIRNWYDAPILIVDDSSNSEFLHDNLKLVNCHIIYDTENKGCGELLGYYYYHLLKPFKTAVILHDSVFIQKWIDFSLQGNMQFLWTFNSAWDHELESYYKELCAPMPLCEEMMAFYYLRRFRGCFGLMSVITWDFLDLLVEDGLLLALGQIKGRRDARSALERVLGFMALRRDPSIQAKWGEIHSYMRWGTTFLEYLGGSVGDLEMVKVWTGR
jgi:hypothetical protein